MPTIEISERLHRQLDERADETDVEGVVWRALARTRPSQDEL